MLRLSALALPMSGSLQVKETTHDACFLHNEQFFAAAQKRYTYIYDKRGLEVHCLEVSCVLFGCTAVHCAQLAVVLGGAG